MPPVPEDGVHRRRRRARRRRPRLGAHRRRPDALPPAVPAGQRAVPRRAAGARSTCSWSSPARPARTSRAACSPVSVYLSEDYIRAAPGGTGDVKCAGNYAASLLAQEQAIAAGCDQVVWLDAVEKRYVEEMGGMNLFFVLGSGDDAELVTPALTGTLLPGITRDSLITLARELGHTVTERLFTVDEWRAGRRRRHGHRDLRLRHRRRHHPGRRGQGAHRRLHRRRRHARPADHAAARDAARHPARAGGRHPRLAAPGRLSAAGRRRPCCAGGGWRPPRVTSAGPSSPSACTTASTGGTRS